MPHSRSGVSSPGDMIEEEGVAVLLANAEELIRHLKGLARDGGKGKSRDQEDAVGDGLMRLAALLKKSDELQMVLGKEETVRRYVRSVPCGRGAELMAVCCRSSRMCRRQGIAPPHTECCATSSTETRGAGW